MKAHTPGPWNVVNHNWHETSIYSVAIERRVCKLDTEDWGVDEDTQDEFEQIQEADARLIAAAPDLLTALQGARKVIEIACGETAPYVRIALGQIDAAINKAKGEQA